MTTPLVAPGPATADADLPPLEVPGRWQTVAPRLAQVVAARGDHLAVASPGQAYSYAELGETATRWARALAAHLADVPIDRPVAMVAEPTARYVVAFWAVVLSGRPVLPLDPMLPVARRDHVLSASGALEFDVDRVAALPDAPAHELPEAAPADPAVIFYTSGSSGAPKGLVHSQLTWLNQAYSSQVALDLAPEDRNALLLPLGFGGGLDVVFMSALTGSALLVYDPRVRGVGELADWLAEQRATTVHATPSLLRALLDALPDQATLDGIRQLTTCGEAIHSTLVERLHARMQPGAAYVGLSGASEIGILAYHRLPVGQPVPEGIVPVGTPAPNKQVRIVDAEGRELPAGEVGEVEIVSRYLASGYHGDPERTAERFRPTSRGAVAYRGGDLGRLDPDGTLHLRGRADAAVKIGGYLVEPAEVEAALLAIPQLREAVVTVTEHRVESGVRKRLVAHVVPETTERPITPASIRRRLRESLPSWMVPSEIVLLSALPRNERGKVDRGALPAARPTYSQRERETVTEKLLAELWRSVLRIPTVSTDADFWELGADSLSVEEMIAAIRQTHGVGLGSADLAQAPTIRELAALIDNRDGGTRELPATAVRLRDGSARPPVFAFAGGGASALSLLPIASALGTDVAVHGFHAAGYDSRALPDFSVAAVCRRHLKVIRRVAPHGPYVLVGHSYGGLLALETARRLKEAGEHVPLVVLLDTILPEHVAARAAAVTGTPRSLTVPTEVPPLRQRLLTHARQLGAGLVRYRPEVRDEVFWEQSYRLVNRHDPDPWSGRTLLFRAEANPDEPIWWQTLLTGEHEVITVPGGHSAILRAPFSEPIIDRLSAELQALRGSEIGAGRTEGAAS